jgi:hypothetical protein
LPDGWGRQSPTQFFLQREELEVSTPIARFLPISSLTNLAIAQNVIRSAHETNVKKLLFLGSSCIYPKMAPQPMTEDMLLSGPLDLPINGTPSQGLRESNFVKPTASNTGRILSQSCRQIFMAAETTTIPNTVMCRLPLSVASTRPRFRVLQRSQSGVQDARDVNSSLLTT